MSREFNVLAKLSTVYQPAPKPLLYCADEAVIGSEFYLMERRRGLIIRGALSRTACVSGRVDSGKLTRFKKKSRRIVHRNLANLHALDYEEIGLSDLGKPEGYALRQVEGWTKRYFNAKTDEHSELEKSIEWLNANLPASTARRSFTTIINSTT